MKVLIVDDNEQEISMIRESFVDIPNITTIFATTANKAMELAVKQKPDLIMLDVVMPKMDGIELRVRLARDCETAKIPVVFITGSGDAEKKCWQIGCIDFITKPFKPEKLRDIIQKQALMSMIDSIIESNKNLCRLLEA